VQICTIHFYGVEDKKLTAVHRGKVCRIGQTHFLLIFYSERKRNLTSLCLSISAPGSKSDFIMDDECYINCPEKRTTYEWHLNDRNDFALKKAKKFRLQYEKLYVARHWLVS